jgi:hypothetical protein
MAEGFLLGPNLLSQIRRTIDRVDGEPIGSGFRRTQVALEGEGPRSAKVFRICTFTGSWAINATKTVTFKYQTSTPNTASVVNLFFPYPATTNATDCAIAKDGTAWHLIDVPFQTATAVFSGGTTTQTVVSDVVVAAVLNTSNCQITVTRTNTTAAITIVQSTFTSVFVRFGA